MYTKYLLNSFFALICILNCGESREVIGSSDIARIEEAKRQVLLKFDQGESRLLSSVRIKEFCINKDSGVDFNGCGSLRIGDDFEILPDDLLKISIPAKIGDSFVMVVESRNWLQDRADAVIFFSKQNEKLKNCKIEDVRSIGFSFVPRIQCPPLKLLGSKSPIISFSPTNTSYEDPWWSLQSLWLIVTLIPNLGGHSFYLRVTIEQ